MSKWENISQNDKVAIRQKAEEYKIKYSNKVYKMIRDARQQVEPEDSDLFKPELWKAIHWKWYNNLRKI